MSKPLSLIPYFFKYQRYRHKLTLRHLAKQLNMDNTYLSKIENGHITPSDIKLHQLLRFYKTTIKQFEYCQFTQEFVYEQLNKIYYVEFTKKDYANIEEMIYKHRNSQYVGHLKLILWCYDAVYARFNSKFNQEMIILSNTIDAFSNEEKEFFLICKCIFHIQRRQKKDADIVLNNLKHLQSNWQGFRKFIKVKYDYYFEYYFNMPKDIELCTKQLKEDHNNKRLPFMTMLEALFYSHLGLHDQSIQIYKQQLSYLKQIHDDLNTSVVMSNLGNQHLYKHEYNTASEYFQKAILLKNNNSNYFDLAWCYYNLGQKEECEKTIRHSIKAKTQYPAYTELLEWLSQMVKRPYSKTCLNILLRIEKMYFEQLGPRAKVFLYIAISNHYQHDENFRMANQYLKKVIQENITTAIELQ